MTFLYSFVPLAAIFGINCGSLDFYSYFDEVPAPGLVPCFFFLAFRLRYLNAYEANQSSWDRKK